MLVAAWCRVCLKKAIVCVCWCAIRSVCPDVSWLPQVEVVHGDILSRDILNQAMQGVSAAYYFIHNMSSGRNYFEKEIESARNFASAASCNCDVEHIIYLGGLADPEKISACTCARASRQAISCARAAYRSPNSVPA